MITMFKKLFQAQPKPSSEQTKSHLYSAGTQNSSEGRSNTKKQTYNVPGDDKPVKKLEEG